MHSDNIYAKNVLMIFLKIFLAKNVLMIFLKIFLEFLILSKKMNIKNLI